MLNLIGHATTPDKLKLITGSAGGIDTHVSFADMDASLLPAAAVKDVNKENHAISTAATTDICAGITTGTSWRRNVKYVQLYNSHATVSNTVTVVYDAIDGTDYVLAKAVLAPGEALEFVEGVGWYKTAAAVPVPIGTNFNMTASAAGFATDTYVSGSAVDLDALGTPRVGRRYIWRLLISKTAAGTATPILTVRVGTAGTTADTARNVLTWGAGTAAIDRGEIELEVIVTNPGASGQTRAKANWTTNLQTTGLSNGVKALFVQSGAFDLTVPNSLIGLSYNGGTSAVHTIEWVTAATDDL